MSDFLDQLGDQFDGLAGSEGQKLRRRRHLARSAAGVSLCGLAALAWASLGSAPVELQATADPAGQQLDGIPEDLDPPSTPLSVPANPENASRTSTPPDQADTTVPVSVDAPAAASPSEDKGEPDEGEPEQASRTDGADSADGQPCTAAPISADADQLDAAGSGPLQWVEGLTISAFGADGSPAELYVARDRIGVAGGRYDYQLDFMPEAEASERLRLQFVYPVCGLDIGVTLLERGEFEDLDELLQWSAVDGDGAILTSDTIGANEGSAARSIIWFSLPVPAGTTAVDLQAAPYRPDLAAGAGSNSSDYAVAAIRAS